MEERNDEYEQTNKTKCTNKKIQSMGGYLIGAVIGIVYVIIRIVAFQMSGSEDTTLNEEQYNIQEVDDTFKEGYWMFYPDETDCAFTVFVENGDAIWCMVDKQTGEIVECPGVDYKIEKEKIVFEDTDIELTYSYKGKELSLYLKGNKGIHRSNPY